MEDGPNPPLDGDDSPVVGRVAQEMIEHRGAADAARYTYEQAEIADALPDMLSAETWRDIADAIERLQSS